VGDEPDLAEALGAALATSPSGGTHLVPAPPEPPMAGHQDFTDSERAVRRLPW
jgi:hypothetical protein